MSSVSYSISSLQKEIEKLNKEIEVVREKTTIKLEIPDDIIEFCKTKRILNKKPFDFTGRDYLFDIYRTTANRTIIVKARQMEITEFAVNYLIYNMLKSPITCIYTSPRYDQVLRFSKERFRKAIRESKLDYVIAPSEAFRRQIGTKIIKFVNGSILYCLSGWNEFDAIRGIPADLIIVDEAQSFIQPTALPVLEECLSHSKMDRLIMIGTPLFAGQPFEDYWLDSDMRYWNKDKKVWEPKQRSKNGFVGYHIDQYMGVDAGFLTIEKIERKRKTYSEQRFMNEVLGMFYSGASVPYLPHDLLNIMIDEPVITHVQPPNKTYIGVDWGTSKDAYTVVSVMQKREDGKYEVINIERLTQTDLNAQTLHIKDMIRRYNAEMAFVDVGFGAMQLQILQSAYGSRVLGVYYSMRPEKPLEFKNTDFGLTCMADRTYVLDRLQAQIKNKKILIRKPITNIDWLVEAFTCQNIETKTLSGGREVKVWKKLEHTHDDAMHSIAYSYLACLYGSNELKIIEEREPEAPFIPVIDSGVSFDQTQYGRELGWTGEREWD